MLDQTDWRPMSLCLRLPLHFDAAPERRRRSIRATPRLPWLNKMKRRRRLVSRHCDIHHSLGTTCASQSSGVVASAAVIHGKHGAGSLFEKHDDARLLAKTIIVHWLLPPLSLSLWKKLTFLLQFDGLWNMMVISLLPISLYNIQCSHILIELESIRMLCYHYYYYSCVRRRFGGVLDLMGCWIARSDAAIFSRAPRPMLSLTRK